MVGLATCGISAGADKVWKALEGKIAELQLDVVLEQTGCIGFCQKEPLVDVVYPKKVRISYQSMTPEKAEALVTAIKNGEVFQENTLCRIDQEEFIVEGTSRPYANPHPPELPGEIPRYDELPFFGKQVKIALRNCGFINPERIEEYIGRGGYTALHQVLTGMSPAAVIAEVKGSGLRGRGGAGFPTGMKWEFAAKNEADQKYVICNADEGDPGAYMDRSLLEGNPHSVLEGMIIGAYAMGANEGYIYVRNEYPLAVENAGRAIAQARELGLIGEDIFSSGFEFDVKIARGGGAFICGESSALMASWRGSRAARGPSTSTPWKKASGRDLPTSITWKPGRTYRRSSARAPKGIGRPGRTAAKEPRYSRSSARSTTRVSSRSPWACRSGRLSTTSAVESPRARS